MGPVHRHGGYLYPTGRGILDSIIAERQRLNRRACAVTLYRAERRKQIVREGPGLGAA